MKSNSMYHDGMRHFQDRFETRPLADRLEEMTVKSRFSEYYQKMIERSSFFLLATTDQDGWPDCSYKGGLPGFVRVLDEQTLIFPSYDGNGMYRSLGNIQANPKVSLLFIDFERPKRLRILGTASVHDDNLLLKEFPGAQALVRVQADRIFPNCPRYIHHMELTQHSEYAPSPDHEPPIPEWKTWPEIREVLPSNDPSLSIKKQDHEE